MATINMPKRNESADEAILTGGQGRRTLQRFWLQIDRQTKASFSTLADAEKAGQAIKSAHPIVQVSVYDAEESQQTTLTA